MPADPPSWAAAWAHSGAMALTGRADGEPLVAPDGVVERIVGLGRRLGVDVLALTGERAAIEGLQRAGDRSCGGSARFVATTDGWLVVQLARSEDRDAVAAWLELDGPPPPDRLWSVIEHEVTRRRSGELVERAELLALPFARLGEVLPQDRPGSSVPPGPAGVPPGPRGLDGLPLRARPIGGDGPTAPPIESRETPLVVDLSSLWAGPLAARLLADRGARVVKVESSTRPDGARQGPPAFYDRLHHGTRSVAIDLGQPAGQARLRELIAQADIVIEGSRSRALRAMGIEVDQVLTAGRSRVWVSITGFGRAVDRVAFGDGAAAAGGLVASDDAGPCFAVDAVADPLAGVVAAAGVDAALDAGGSWLLDVSMAEVAAHVAGADRGAVWRSDGRLTASPPRAPAPTAPAPDLGQHNAEVGAELGIDLG